MGILVICAQTVSSYQVGDADWVISIFESYGSSKNDLWERKSNTFCSLTLEIGVSTPFQEFSYPPKLLDGYLASGVFLESTDTCWQSLHTGFRLITVSSFVSKSRQFCSLSEMARTNGKINSSDEEDYCTGCTCRDRLWCGAW